MKQIFYVLLATFFVATPLKAQEQTDSLDLPRMSSLRSNLINARSGPGSRYPIEWVYMQKGAPVEVVAEFEHWRKIKDWDGQASWVHKAMLSSLRMAKVITLGQNNIYKRASLDSQVIAKVEDGAVGEIKECPKDKAFCLLDFQGLQGWVKKSDIFGIYDKEEI